jgi:hypothetical protein
MKVDNSKTYVLTQRDHWNHVLVHILKNVESWNADPGGAVRGNS